MALIRNKSSNVALVTDDSSNAALVRHKSTNLALVGYTSSTLALVGDPLIMALLSSSSPDETKSNAPGSKRKRKRKTNAKWRVPEQATTKADYVEERRGEARKTLWVATKLLGVPLQ